MGDDKNIVKLVQGDISFYSVMGADFWIQGNTTYNKR